MMKSYLPLCSDDGGRFEKESVVGLVVIHVGGVEDDLLEVGVIRADVDRCSRKEVASLVNCQHQHHPCRNIIKNNEEHHFFKWGVKLKINSG